MRRRFWLLAALASIAAVVSLQSASAMTRLEARRRQQRPA